MDNKLKKMLIILLCVGLCGIILITLYYYKYNSDTDYRHSHNIENIINSESTTELMINTEKNKRFVTSDSPSSSESNASTSDSIPGIPQREYESELEKMKNLIYIGNYKEAYDSADNLMHKYRANGDQLKELNNIQSFISVPVNDPSDNENILRSFKDPDLYVAMFYILPIEYQYDILRDKNQPFISAQTGKNMSIITTTTAGPNESNAYKFFSEFNKVKIYKVKINVNNVEYNIYCAYKDNMDMTITKIENADPANHNITTYDQYFKIYGKSSISSK